MLRSSSQLRGIALIAVSSLALTACANLDHGTSRFPGSSSSSTSGTSGTSGSARAAAGTTSASAGKAAEVSMAFPTGNPETSALVLDKTAPAQVNVNTPYRVQMDVRNVTDLTLENVVVTETLPAGYQLTGSNPTASVRGDVATFALGAVRPGDTRTITMEGKATKTGPMVGCTNVEYASNLCASTMVISPALQISKTAPTEQIACDPIELAYVVTNPGTGLAQGVRITDNLPEGWTTMDGKRVVDVKVGDLAGGKSESRKVRVKAENASAGRFASKAVAASTNGLTAESTAPATVLRRPALTVTSTAPKTAFAGQSVKVAVTVKNTGDGVAKDVTLVENLPSGARMIAASNGGKKSGNKVTWDIGTLQPGAQRVVDMTLTSDEMGSVVCRAQAEGECAAPAVSSTTFNMTGIPAVLLEVTDLTDPISVGDEVTYLIEIKNQGSAEDQDIKIVCTLEDGVEFVRSSGDAKSTVSGKTISFAPIPRLAPKAVATLRVTVKGTRPADSRFAVSLTTAEKTRPISETEATTFYQ